MSVVTQADVIHLNTVMESKFTRPKLHVTQTYHMITFERIEGIRTIVKHALLYQSLYLKTKHNYICHKYMN